MSLEGRKKNVTLSIDEDVKKKFNIEVINNNSDMSSTVEAFMINYTKASINMRENKLKNSNNEQG